MAPLYSYLPPSQPTTFLNLATNNCFPFHWFYPSRMLHKWPHKAGGHLDRFYLLSPMPWRSMQMAVSLHSSFLFTVKFDSTA